MLYVLNLLYFEGYVTMVPWSTRRVVDLPPNAKLRTMQ